MRGMRRNGGIRAAACLSGGAVVVIFLGACGGGSHFKNLPRPPIPNQLTGVVTDTGISVSPNHVGGGPMTLDVSNQTQQSHTIVLERAGEQGEPHRDMIGPLHPLQSAPLTQTLTPGQYTVSIACDPA